MAILELNNVTYIYKNKWQTTRAVNNVSYAFDCGKVYAIVGKSGSGKTTLLSMLAGLDTPTEGQVLFDGTPTNKINRDAYRRNSVSVIYQSYNLFPLLTILENVTYPLELCGMKPASAREKAKKMIEVVGLTDVVYRRYPAMLSGGEQQRIAIARALCSSAKVMLADEPTGNLDTENTANIISILKDLAHREGYCVIIVTHDMAVAEKADVIIRMTDGNLIPEA
ncbi:MAG: ABC transporter ATP-binding protein [Clostridia bacterium]|nr:ABC transporter ATP-binding protein [Clostridia bacterium]